MSKVYWFHFFRKPIIGKFSGTNQRSKKDRRTRKTKKMVGTMAKIDDSVKKKVPELRFPGFTDDWEERKLGDLATSLEYGLNASAKSFDGTHKYIRITDIDDSSRKFNSQSLTSPDIDLSSADNYKLKNGDILFARTGASVGKSYIYADSDGLVYYAGFLIRARIKSGVDSNFVFQHTLTSSYENFIRVTSQRSGQPGVNAKEYSTFEISVPSYEEQRKIGSFFKQLDDTITLHQRKIDLLKEQKKGYLQKMFPKNGAKVPELRFAGFADDWEERKSKDIFKHKIRKGEPDLPVLSVTQTSGVVYRDEVGIDIKYDISTLKNYKVIEPNDFVISLRSFQGGFELSDKLGITSPAYTIFVPKSPEEQNNLFWRIQFKRFQFIQSLKTVTFGIRDGKSISFNEFGDLKIKFPSNILEQQKIGAFFKELDNTIALHQRKLDLLKEQKKGFLQKMFV